MHSNREFAVEIEQRRKERLEKILSRELTDEDYKAMEEAENYVLDYYEKHGRYPNDD